MSPRVLAAAPPSEIQSPPGEVDLVAYPWHADKGAMLAADSLENRFAPPRGFRRVSLDAVSFAGWLRRIPLAAEGTPVRSYRGQLLYPADHPNIAAVTTLDPGTADLQQCADAVMRLHAEWQWFLGNRNYVAKAASGLLLPFAEWRKGKRVVFESGTLRWAEKAAAQAPTHQLFREYLDAVFAWANTGSLARDTTLASRDQVTPGDFFVLPGNPGHTVIVLDIAQNNGSKVALLGQGYMPAQGFYVLRPSPNNAWFSLDSDKVKTPFWRPFPWSSLHRWGNGSGQGVGIHADAGFAHPEDRVRHPRGS